MILVEEGQGPVILCLPNSGTEIPEAVSKRLNATGRLQADLSWQLERVFDFNRELDVTVIRSTISRYVIDVDKDPETPLSAAFDPAAALCPVTTLDGKRIYQKDEEPGPTEVEQRVLLFHAPFHKTLRQQVDRLMSSHRKVIVLDCQSMRSHIKGVTETGLPLVSIGSAHGTSCHPDLRNLFVGSFTGQQGFTVGVDTQTRGGLITETFGRPDLDLHAMTLLLAQRSYLRHESPPFEPDKQEMNRLQTILSDSISRIADWAMICGEGGGPEPSEEPRPAGAGAVESASDLEAVTAPELEDGPAASAGGTAGMPDQDFVELEPGIADVPGGTMDLPDLPRVPGDEQNEKSPDARRIGAK